MKFLNTISWGPKEACHPQLGSIHSRTSFWAGHLDWEAPPRKLPYRRMSALWRHWRSKSHSWDLIMDNINSTLIAHNLLTQHHWKIWRTEILMVPSSRQPLSSEFLSKTTLQPNSTTNNSTTNTTSYDITQHVSPSSQALEHKQGKYRNESWPMLWSVETQDRKKCYWYQK